ncbi:DUF6119 family protein [Canibacter oris]|uniref:Uncharacterized protein (TIGR04141 family) n=1 Tax=Canibacter oris TaxID=1365628 RepID=A0A840DQC6_9MICO|nr:DUF6119 family protein [Canibacter oris]MBB4071396.1 uncharacterized protein (TIGR04141 family) [Canibacter oris]
MAKQRITMYLLNESVNTFKEALHSEKKLQTMTTKLGDYGYIYYENPIRNTPKWANFLKQFSGHPALDNINVQSSSALFLFKFKKRFFALTFGHGRNFLDLSKIEHRFGLKVVLSEIKPQDLKSVDFKEYEDGVISNSKNSARKTSIYSFGIDSATDILRGVTGSPSDNSYFQGNIAGGDSLVFTYDSDWKSGKNSAPIRNLFAFCKKILKTFNSNNYKKYYDWIDDLSIVKDAQLIKELNNELITDLRNINVDLTYLAPPDVIAWEDIEHFKITGTSSYEYTELDLKEYLNKLTKKAREKIDISKLKSRNVYVTYSRSGVSEKRWTLYRCLVSEKQYKDKQYALLEGEWYEINQALATKVNSAINEIAHSNLTLPPANKGEKEAEYNRRIASSSKGSIVLMDKKIIYPEGAPSGVEFCDLYSLSDKNMIHVKRKSQSATLSHLFAQGVVASQCLLHDAQYRNRIRSYFQQSLTPNSANNYLNSIPETITTADRDKYKITFAVITDSTRTGKDWLPFFSKVNLMGQAKFIRGLGLQLEILKVPITAANEKKITRYFISNK